MLAVHDSGRMTRANSVGPWAEITSPHETSRTSGSTSMIEVRYLLDNNALGRMTPGQRAMPFVKEACRVPARVLYEARGFPDIETLKELEYPTSASVLLAVQQIMRLVNPMTWAW